MIDFIIDKDIAKAQSLHSNFYTKKEYFDLSINKIFNKSWQLICHQSDLLEKNIYPFHA